MATFGTKYVHSAMVHETYASSIFSSRITFFFKCKISSNFSSLCNFHAFNQNAYIHNVIVIMMPDASKHNFSQTACNRAFCLYHSYLKNAHKILVYLSKTLDDYASQMYNCD